jgi:outer membrane biosynthesis protein TonB
MSAYAIRVDWRKPGRRRTATAAALSVLVHLLLILGAAWVLGFRPPQPPPVAEREDPPVEITFLNTVPEPRKNTPAYMETTPEQAVDKPNENPAFESDKNTVAASELPAAGDAPVPTTDGETAPGISLQNRDYSPGREARPAAPPAQLTPPVEAVPPQPVAEAQPVPTPQPRSEVALLEPPKPKTPPKPTPDQAREKAPEKPAVRPAPPTAPGYQPQTRITRIRGNISNRGRAAVAANATPLGRYKKMLSDAIGSRWYYYVNDRIGLLDIGTLEVTFVVRESGKVERVKVVSNSSNESFAACSIQAIMEAEIPPIPAEIVPLLENGRIEIEYSFTILSN